MTARPFRFAAQIDGAPNAKSWADRARQAEDLGYSSLTMPDHFGDQLAPVPALMAAADATTTLRIGMLGDPATLDPAQSSSINDRVAFGAFCDKLIDLERKLDNASQPHCRARVRIMYSGEF